MRENKHKKGADCKRWQCKAVPCVEPTASCHSGDTVDDSCVEKPEEGVWGRKEMMVVGGQAVMLSGGMDDGLEGGASYPTCCGGARAGDSAAASFVLSEGQRGRESLSRFCFTSVQLGAKGCLLCPWVYTLGLKAARWEIWIWELVSAEMNWNSEHQVASSGVH